MPLAWTPKFLERIKETVNPNRLKDRIKETIGPQVQEPETLEQTKPREEQPGFVRTIRDRVQRMPAVQRRLLDPDAPLDMPMIKYRIKYAAENRLVLRMRYRGKEHSGWREVEPYSYRWDGVPSAGWSANERVRKTQRRRLMFKGYCREHGQIHSFDPERIEALEVTDVTFSPRWPIELD